MFVNVAFPIPYTDHFTYRIDPDLTSHARPGIMVLAPFRDKSAPGVILEVTQASDLPESNIRKISAFGDINLAVAPDVMELVVSASRKYGTTPGMVLRAALPPGSFQIKSMYFYPGPAKYGDEVPKAIHDFIELIRSNPGGMNLGDIRKNKNVTRLEVEDLIRRGILSLSPRQLSQKMELRGQERWIVASAADSRETIKLSGKSEMLLEAVAGREEGLRFSSLKSLGFSPASATTLHRQGLVDYVYREKSLPESGGLKSLEKESVLELTLWQRSALEKIEAAFQKNRYRGFLLYGVTSSGKTQVYLEAAKIALARGKSALVLVPEISLTPQIVERFERFLKVKPLVWHSGLSRSEKYLVYKAIKAGKSRLVIGARSAIFSPLGDLGLIVVDEEQDGSYKQDDPAPRYNARDLALERGKINNGVVILGSATPSCESYYSTLNGDIEMLQLPQRVSGGPKPEVKVISTKIDPEKGPKSIFPRGFWPVSVPLYEELSIRLKNREQVIMLLNRRGYSSVVVCFECGWLGKCPDCQIGWTYHKTVDKLICHYCGKEQRGLSACPKCGSARLSFRGAGTERLEETLRDMFPSVRMERLDSDTAARRRESGRILERFARAEFQILLGTQMVAKGHHFPGVGLSAVIGADIGISLPDFRASERVLQLLIQAAGRAGRAPRKKEPGLVMAQTFSPENPIFEFLKREDYIGFLKSELEIREQVGYPPFKKIILVVVSSQNKVRSKNASRRLKDQIAGIIGENGIEVLGPAEAPIFKRGKLYRYQILIKIDPQTRFEGIIDVIRDFARKGRGVAISLDIDPVNFL
jgi:primosomal protein N' (replication factor Y)